MDSNKKWRLKNPKKVRAHWMVGNAIRYGKIKRQPCEKCGNSKSHAHHSDYSKPLEIKWLCHNCHWKAHGWIAQPKQKREGIRNDAKKPILLAQALDFRNNGLSYSEIGARFNCSKGTIYKWLNNTKYH